MRLGRGAPVVAQENVGSEPKQAEQAPDWSELLVAERAGLRDEYDRLERSGEPDQRQQSFHERTIIYAVFDLILAAAGRDRGEPPRRAAENVASRVQLIARRLLNVLDDRYEPKARQPEHDYSIPHAHRPGLSPECPASCPAQLPAPSLTRLHASLTAAGIPLVTALVEAPQAPEQSMLDVVAALLGLDKPDDDLIAEAIGRLQGKLAKSEQAWRSVAMLVNAPPELAPDYLVQRVATLAASERQQTEASSHRQQLREHYRQALAELVAVCDDRPILAEQLTNTVEKARRALDNPPEWDGKARP